jgi:hypothetical protein
MALPAVPSLHRGENMESPRVASFVWGRVDVDGRGTFKDVKLFPGGCREWDWDETGTRHSPGVQVGDVEEIVAAGAEVVVLSRGVHQQLQVPAETVEWLQAQGITVHVLQTERAIERYNELAATVRVGALIHSTC